MSDQLVVDAIFDALGEPMRRRILECLRAGELPVGELARRLPVGRPAVSKHLGVLETAGLITHTSRGTRNLYALSPRGLDDVQEWLDTVWHSALDAFGNYVETIESAPAAAPDANTSEPRSSP